MNFANALNMLVAGQAVRRTDWLGYWVYNKETDDIEMHCVDRNTDSKGESFHERIVSFRNPENLIFTLANICADDWELCDRCTLK